MSDKVLFELHIHTNDGETHFEVYESAEWRAYHRASPGARRVDREGCGPGVWLARLCGEDADSTGTHSDPRKRPFRARPFRAHSSGADDLRRTLNSLQNIYNDLYGDVTA